MNVAEKFISAMQSKQSHSWPAAPGRQNNRKAAIMIPIFNDGSWTVVMTKRKKELHAHGGEMCFPGGKPEPRDRALKDTALRETAEEIGLKGGDVVGRLSSIPLYTSEFRLEPFVGLYPIQTIEENPSEVDCCLLFSLIDLLGKKEIQGVGMNWPNYGSFVSPVFFPEEFTKNPTTTTPIFGGTAHVLWELLTVFAGASGRTLPRLNPCLSRIPKHIE